jgi:hypothetical protein
MERWVAKKTNKFSRDNVSRTGDIVRIHKPHRNVMQMLRSASSGVGAAISRLVGGCDFRGDGIPCAFAKLRALAKVEANTANVIPVGAIAGSYRSCASAIVRKSGGDGALPQGELLC